MNYWEYTGGGDYLSHHGIDGQQWGVRNGPPYPLGNEGKFKRKNYKRKDYKHMDDQELDAAIQRLAKEKYYKQLVFDVNKTPGYDMASRAASKAAEEAAKNASKIAVNEIWRNIK